MTEWPKCSLGDVLTLQRGFDLPASTRREGGVPVVSSAGPSGFHDEAKAKAPGVVIGRYGTLGEVHFVQVDYWPLNTTLWVKDFKSNDPRFCAYLLKTIGVAETSGAAAVPGVNRNVLHALPIHCPNLETQQRIAAILGAYDDLIEVNRRRVAVLEEMARGLFEEWFVRFRFPGHERATMVDTRHGPLPQKWEWGALKKVLALRSGFAFKSSTFVEGGQYSLVTIKHVHDGLLRPPFESKIREPPKNMPEHCKIIEGDILVSLTGNVGRTCLAWGEDLLLNQRVAKVEPSEKQYRAFAYCWFRSSDTLQRLKNIANGAAQQNLSPVQTVGLIIPIPPRQVAAQFEHVVHPILESIVLAHRSIAVLQDQRDLLLPRLISGQLSVDTAERELQDAA